MQWRATTVQPQPYYPRAALLDWIRGNAPDFRVLHVMRDGQPACAARFTVDGTEHRYFVAKGQQSTDGTVIDDPADAIVRICHQALARLLDVTVARGRSRVDRERDIIAASARGDTDMADRLARSLAADNEQETRRRAQLRTQFGNRSTW